MSDRYSLKGPRWAELSEKAKHFVHSLLRKDPNDRLTASEAQEHSWLNWKNKGAQASASIDTKVLRDMSQFAATNTITRTALGLLAKRGQAGGVLTPAAALGDDLWARLESAKWDAADEAPAVAVEHA